MPSLDTPAVPMLDAVVVQPPSVRNLTEAKHDSLAVHVAVDVADTLPFVVVTGYEACNALFLQGLAYLQKNEVVVLYAKEIGIGMDVKPAGFPQPFFHECFCLGSFHLRLV